MCFERLCEPVDACLHYAAATAGGGTQHVVTAFTEETNLRRIREQLVPALAHTRGCVFAPKVHMAQYVAQRFLCMREDVHSCQNW